MRLAVIRDGIVTDVTKWDDGLVFVPNPPAEVARGWVYAGGVFSAAPQPPPAVPAAVERWRLKAVLGKALADVDAAIAGSKHETLIAYWADADELARNSVLAALIGEVTQRDEAGLDKLWQDAEAVTP